MKLLSASLIRVAGALAAIAGAIAAQSPLHTRASDDIKSFSERDHDVDVYIRESALLDGEFVNLFTRQVPSYYDKMADRAGKVALAHELAAMAWEIAAAKAGQVYIETGWPHFKTEHDDCLKQETYHKEVGKKYRFDEETIRSGRNVQPTQMRRVGNGTWEATKQRAEESGDRAKTSSSASDMAITRASSVAQGRYWDAIGEKEHRRANQERAQAATARELEAARGRSRR